MMAIRITIDGEVVNHISFGRFVEAMIDCGHEAGEVAGMVVDLMHDKPVRDGGGASPVFEYALLPTIVSLR